jgi:hypothetical protein
MPKEAPMQVFGTSASPYPTPPVVAPPHASKKNSENLKRSSKSAAAIRIAEWTNILNSSVDYLSGELSDLKYGSDTSDEIPILTKKRLASTRSNRNQAVSMPKKTLHKRLRSSSAKDKTPKSTGELATGRFLRNVNRNLGESAQNRVGKNRPNFQRDNLANIMDFDSITYPAEIVRIFSLR